MTLLAVVWLLVVTNTKDGSTVNLDAFSSQAACEQTIGNLTDNAHFPEIKFSCERIEVTR